MSNDVTKILSEYFNERYERWLDFSRYHCSKNGLAGEEEDVLMKVIEDIWQKDHQMLYDLLNQKKSNGTGIDFYILRILKIYITMPRSPYRWKYHTRKLNYVESPNFELYNNYEEEIRQEELSDTLELLKKSIYCNHFSLIVVKVLEWILVKGNKDFLKWPGKESSELLEKTYEKALFVLKKQFLGQKKAQKDQLSLF